MSDSTDGTTVQRRSVLAATGTAMLTAVAGCSSGGNEDTTEPDDSDDGNGGGGNTIVVGPNNSLRFDPAELTISTGESVTWEFESPSHNVAAWPDMHDKISVPDDASGFGSMDEGGDKNETVSEGETFEHTFDTAGEYTYVCVPHAASDMVGTIIVE